MKESTSNIVVIAMEEETGLTYSFVFTRDEAAMIIQNAGEDFLELSGERWIRYKYPMIIIKPKGSCQASFRMAEVYKQIQEQLGE